jgi:LysR family hydrogen peroxide-inducible transcriptional activator
MGGEFDGIARNSLFSGAEQDAEFHRGGGGLQASQPALTRAIQKMEDELGGLLFSRERNNIHLTELGRLMEPNLREVMERTQAAKESASSFLCLDSVHLRVGVMCTIGPIRFVTFLSQFRAENPGVEITLVEHVSAQLSDMLAKGEIDVAVMASPEEFAAPLQAQPLYGEKFAIACSAGHPFARKNAVRMAEMDGQHYLQRIDCEYRDRLREASLGEALAEQGVDVVRSYRSEREDWI